LPIIAGSKREFKRVSSGTTNYSTDDGNERQEDIDSDGNINGHYSYIDPTGKRIVVNYTAGVDGFKARGNHFADFKFGEVKQNHEIEPKVVYKSPSISGFKKPTASSYYVPLYKKQQKQVDKIQLEDQLLSYINQKTKINHNPIQESRLQQEEENQYRKAEDDQYQYEREENSQYKRPNLHSLNTQVPRYPSTQDISSLYLKHNSEAQNYDVKEVNEENHEEQEQNQYRYQGEQDDADRYEEVRIPVEQGKTFNKQLIQYSEIEAENPDPRQSSYLNNNNNNYEKNSSPLTSALYIKHPSTTTDHKYTNILENVEFKVPQKPVQHVSSKIITLPISEEEFERKYGKQTYETAKFVIEDEAVPQLPQEPQNLYNTKPEYKDRFRTPDRVNLFNSETAADGSDKAANENEIREFLRNIDRQNKEEEGRIELLVRSYPATLAQYQQYLKGQQEEKLGQSNAKEQEKIGQEDEEREQQQEQPELQLKQLKKLFNQSPAQKQKPRVGPTGRPVYYTHTQRRSQSTIRPATSVGLSAYRTTAYKEPREDYETYSN
jgi:hypothetical protein